MLVADYGRCLAEGGMEDPERHSRQSFFMKTLADELTPDVTGDLVWKSDLMVFNVRLNRKYQSDLHYTMPSSLRRASQVYRCTPWKKMKKWYDGRKGEQNIR